jgi:positive regulator of sigma E activity
LDREAIKSAILLRFFVLVILVVLIYVTWLPKQTASLEVFSAIQILWFVEAGFAKTACYEKTLRRRPERRPRNKSLPSLPSSNLLLLVQKDFQNLQEREGAYMIFMASLKEC